MHSDNGTDFYTLGVCAPTTAAFQSLWCFFKGSCWPGLLFLGPSPFDVYYFTTGLVINVFTKFMIYLFIKSSKTDLCM